MRLDSSFQLVGLTYTFKKLRLDIFQKMRNVFHFFLGALGARYKFAQRIDLRNRDRQDILQGVLQAVGTFKMKCIAPELSIIDPRVQLPQIVA